ncbi:MAG: agmatinase [Desulfobacteraceae bacterium 4572_89]|nr:MAG: agmatinase [Desulfobacteraceae bacterium 4572_89]
MKSFIPYLKSISQESFSQFSSNSDPIGHYNRDNYTIDQESICVLGIPFDANSSFRRGPALAPSRIRENYFSDSSNLWTEYGIDLGSISSLYDMGDLDCADTTSGFNAITNIVDTLLKKGAGIISLGGDHSITFPVFKAFADNYDSLNILHLDAHPDLYDTLDNNPFSHACPFARIMEKKMAKRLVQAGIRTINGHQRTQAERLGVEVMEMKDGTEWLKKMEFQGPVYLSIDMDCLDPAFAPGVSHHEPGGFTTRQVIDIIHQVKGNIIGGDIVEYNPERDYGSVTAMVAAKLLKELVGRISADKAL